MIGGSPGRWPSGPENRARISRVAARPSSSGMKTSISTRSKPAASGPRVARIAATAARPFLTTTASQPAFSSTRRASSALISLSSATRTRRLRPGCAANLPGSAASRLSEAGWASRSMPPVICPRRDSGRTGRFRSDHLSRSRCSADDSDLPAFSFAAPVGAPRI